MLDQKDDLSCQMFTLYIYYCIDFCANTKSYPVYHEHLYLLCDSPFKRWCAQCSFSLLKKLSAEIIVLLCKQKSYPVFQIFMPAQQLTSMVCTYNVASVGSYKTQPQLAATKRSLSWQLQNSASVGSYKTQPQLAATKRSFSWQLQNAASVGSYKTQVTGHKCRINYRAELFKAGLR